MDGSKKQTETKVANARRGGERRPGRSPAGRRKAVQRRKVRPALNWDGSLYNDEIPDPESPELPDEPDRGYEK